MLIIALDLYFIIQKRRIQHLQLQDRKFNVIHICLKESHFLFQKPTHRVGQNLGKTLPCRHGVGVFCQCVYTPHTTKKTQLKCDSDE